MRISDWSSDVCSSDLKLFGKICRKLTFEWGDIRIEGGGRETANGRAGARLINMGILVDEIVLQPFKGPDDDARPRSEEHTSELQSLMRISYAVFCLKNTTPHTNNIILSTLQTSSENQTN